MVETQGDSAEVRARIRSQLDEMERATTAWTQRVEEDNERFAAEHADLDADVEDLSDASPEYREVAERVAGGELTWNEVLRGTGSAADDPAVRAVHAEMHRQVQVVREVYELKRRGMSSDVAARAVLAEKGFGGNAR